MAFWFCLVHLIDMYLITISTDNPFNDQYGNIDLLVFATIITQGAEIIVDSAIGLCGLVFTKHRFLLQNTVNQIIKYNNIMLQQMKEKEIEIGPLHKKRIRKIDFLNVTSKLMSFVIPFSIIVCIMCPIEPSHLIFETWLEVKIRFEAQFVIPFFIVSF